MKPEGVGDPVERMIESLREVPPPDPERQRGKRAAFLARARQHSLEAEAVGRRRRRWIVSRRGRSRRWAMVGVVVAILLAMLVGTGGVIYAADEAVPGDPLYGIDQAVESMRLRLTREPQAATELLLGFAEERLSEMEELSARGDQKNLEAALDNYGVSISTLAHELETMEDVDKPALMALLDNALSAHENRFANLLPAGEAEKHVVIGDDTPEMGEGELEPCVGADPHPVAQSLADLYGVPYETIMDWFCQGYGLGEIMHALKTSEETDNLSPEDLLWLKTDRGGWGKVWQELGLIGRPEEKPGGPPDDRPVGPPSNRPIGPPEDKPGGPPDEKPGGGPPDWKPGGPPDKDKGGKEDPNPGGPP
jgi:hypothetical protein